MFKPDYKAVIGIVFTLACTLLLPAAAQRIEPLPPEQAFQFSAAMQNNDAVIVYQMPDGIYLYQNRILITTAAANADITQVTLPPGMPHEDEFFGKSTVYYGQVTIHAAVSGSGEFELLTRIQGCDEQVGICYPPIENTALLTAAASTAGASDTQSGALDYQKDQAGYLAAAIADNNLLWTIALFFILGLGLSFTPCVLPMIPILLGVISNNNGSRRYIITRTILYICGVALAFTVFGVLAALSGQMLATFIQEPWVLLIFAFIFTGLAASLFGAYELQLPAALRRRVAGMGGGGAFLMGVISVIIVSPCVAAPLVGALLYIGQSGNVVIGALALLSLALGMSVLLAVAGIAGSQVLPRAGVWMVQIKYLFGLLLLFVAIWVASPLLPPTVQLILYGVLLLFGGVLLLSPPAADKRDTVKYHLLRTAAIAAMIWGAAMLVGAAGGSRDVLTPLSPFFRSGGGSEQQAVQFQSVANLSELQQITAGAGKPVMLDFYADWCISCKEFERFTLRDARVIARLQNIVLLRADVTENNDDDQALLQHFKLFGPPVILFYNNAGQLIQDVRVTGYQDADEFLNTLTAAGL